MSKVTIRFETPAMAKPRPRGTGNQFYMPPDYMAWKASIAEEVALLYRNTHFTGPVNIAVTVGKMYFIVTIEESEVERHGRADLDNLVGGIFDAIQDAGLIENDRFVTEFKAMFESEDKE